MSEQEIDKVFEIFNNLEEKVSELLGLAGMDANNVISEEVLEQAYEIVMSKLFQEGNVEYIKEKCIQPENQVAYNELKHFLPIKTRIAIDSVVQNRKKENEALQIEDEEVAKEFVIQNKDTILSVKVAKKFWHNNEDAIFQILQNGGNIKLIQAIDVPSEEFIYQCIISEKINCTVNDMRYLVDSLNEVSDEFGCKLLANEMIPASLKHYILEEKHFWIPEQEAINLLKNEKLHQKGIVLKVQQPSEEFLYNIIRYNIKNEGFIEDILKRFDIPDNVLYKCIFNPDLDEYVRKRFLCQVLKKNEIDKDIDVNQLLLEFLNKPTTGELDRKKNMLLEMYSKNDEVLTNININLLDDRYVKRLGIDKINRISIIPNVQRKLLRLDEKEFEIIMQILDNYIEKSQSDDWEEIFSRALDGIENCKELIENIKDISQTDIKKFTNIVLNNNSFEIVNVEDIERIEEIKREKNEEKINSNDIEKMKDAVISKIFGLEDRSKANTILDKFLNGVGVIQNEELKAFVNSLDEILNKSNIEQLHEIYDSCEAIDYVNDTKITRRLKDEYGKLLNEGLLKTQNLTEIEPNIYKAGTNFKIIMTSLQAFSGKHDNEKKYENYRENWNRPKLGTAHFCTSYIRNDMMGMAEIGKVCFGFSEMDNSSLLLMGGKDISSSSWKKDSLGTYSDGKEEYFSPNDLVNNTHGKYNEIDYKRFQNGQRKQPDYILFFRRDSQKEMTEDEKKIWENTQKASKDFGGLPIVIIDVEECLANERNEVADLLNRIHENPNIEDMERLYYKVRNNRKTTDRWGGEFYTEIVIKKLEEQINKLKAEQLPKREKPVSIDDLEENYEQITPEERREGVQMFKRIYQKIMQIKNRETDDPNNKNEVQGTEIGE